MVTLRTILIITALGGVHVGAEVPKPERSYKVLMLLPFASKSHRNVFVPIAEGLADRGHQVTMISQFDPTIKHPNIKEINHGIIPPEVDQNMFDLRKNGSLSGFNLFKRQLPKIAREMYKIPVIEELYKNRHAFDVILVNAFFNEQAYPFTHQMPFIFVSTSGKMPTWSASMGNVLNPAYIPSFKEFERPYSLLSRLENLLFSVGFGLLWPWQVASLVQAEIDQQFPGIPSLSELQKNVSLVLINNHFSLDISSPNLPSQVEVGAMHCKPGRPLPADITNWIEDSNEDGVVYFSLGSVTKGNSMPEEYRSMFVKAFSRMSKLRVIWKHESEIPGLSDNVLRKSWLPQQDILAHPKVKVFITHGGLLSYQESVYHGTPLIALPIFGDQPRNGQMIKSKGFGLDLVWEELTEDIIVQAVEQVVYNPSYQKNVEAASKVLKDQPMSPRDLAIWWTEYVIRHRGAPALRSPAADLSWVEYLMLDVILLFHVMFYALFVALKNIARYFRRNSTPAKKVKLN